MAIENLQSYGVCIEYKSKVTDSMCKRCAKDVETKLAAVSSFLVQINDDDYVHLTMFSDPISKIAGKLSLDKDQLQIDILEKLPMDVKSPNHHQRMAKSTLWTFLNV